MIIRSPSLVRRLDRETERHLGSLAELVFYNGTMPPTCEDRANGEKVMTLTPLPDGLLQGLTRSREPELPEGATYWRIYDNGAICGLQGDGK